jgi:branched-chain amino acid transport system permease protein
MKQTTILLVVASVLILLLIPFLVGNYSVRLATTVFLYAALALSWNIIGGFAGYPSFATSAFFGLGAYTAGIAQHHGVPMVGAWIIGMIACTIFSVGFGAAILRLKGHYFAVGSLLIADVLREIINTSTSVTGGGMGLNIPVFTSNPDLFGRVFYCAMLALMMLALLCTFAVYYSKVGFALRCIQQNEDAANVLGINTTGYKILAFALSGCIAGAAGGIYGSWVSYIDPTDAFDILISVKPIIMTLLGGPGTVMGPIVGAVAFLLFEEVVWRNFMTIHKGLLGLIVVGLVLFLPRGILQIQRTRTRAWSYVKAWVAK